MDYAGDVTLLRADSVLDPELHFSRVAARETAAA
jgi:hypothetical protein